MTHLLWRLSLFSRCPFQLGHFTSLPVGVNFTWEFDGTGTIHARHIVTNQGWKISLDRGLDIFQPYDMNDAFTFANRLQQYRPCKAFEVTFIKQKKQDNVEGKTMTDFSGVGSCGSH